LITDPSKGREITKESQKGLTKKKTYSRMNPNGKKKKQEKKEGEPLGGSIKFGKKKKCGIKIAENKKMDEQGPIAFQLAPVSEAEDERGCGKGQTPDAAESLLRQSLEEKGVFFSIRENKKRETPALPLVRSLDTL